MGGVIHVPAHAAIVTAMQTIMSVRTMFSPFDFPSFKNSGSAEFCQGPLIVFGPGKLSQIGESLGKSIREFKKAMSDKEEEKSETTKNETKL